MANSRTENTVYNFITSIGGQFLSIALQFVVRTVFIFTLGKSYLGIGGLFSNILSMLALSEFGVGSAIIFKLYKPVADGDEERIAVLMEFYKKVYRIIGATIAIMGLCLIPWLPKLIKDYDKLTALNLNVALIFILFLSNTVSSYLFLAYKSAIIKANQEEYLINLIRGIFTIGSSVAQIILLLIYPKFELYVFILIIGQLGQNFVVAKLANRKYPYIKKKNIPKLPFEERMGILKDCSALFLYKVNAVVAKATDSILVSVFLGIEMVGMYSNYYIFYTTISALVFRLFGAVSHSLGNLHAHHDVEREYSVFESVMLISAILGGTACVGVAVVADEFVLRWIGEDWVISQPFSILLGLEIYTLAIRAALGKYRTSMGLFQQLKYRPIAAMLINLVFSIVLIQRWGIYGVLVGTIAMDWLTFVWFDPIVIHKCGFENSKLILRYFRKFLLYFGIAVTAGVIDWFICRNAFCGYGWASIIAHASICAVTVPSLFILVACNTSEGRNVRSLLMNVVNIVLSRLRFVK